MTGLSRAQVTRLIARYRKTGSLQSAPYRRYGKDEFKRLATLSVSHLYDLRQQPRYRERRLRYVKTRPTAVAIGEWRRPDPQAARVSARRHRPSRRSARKEGRLSHRCRR